MSLPRLHILSNTNLQNQFSHLELAQMAFDSGNVCFQYREKNFIEKKHLQELQKIAELSRNYKNYKLIINDFVHKANEINADGVHIGLEDMSVEAARSILGQEKIIGATIHSLVELDALDQSKVNYIGVGPVFGTKSKSTRSPEMGIRNFAEICEKSTVPVIAIGNISLENLPKVLSAGAYGVAILSAFCLSENPTHEAQRFLDIIAGIC